MNAEKQRRTRRKPWTLGMEGAALLCMLMLEGEALAQTREVKRFSHAVFVDLATGFVPYANDVPLMLGIGVRTGGIHEVWGRAGYMPVGVDIGHGFGVVGYRAALRPGRAVRPVFGGYVAALPVTCGFDAQEKPTCSPDRLFIFSGVGGVRIEPRPWLGFSALLSLGVDSYPYPFGMVEVVTTFALPLL